MTLAVLWRMDLKGEVEIQKANWILVQLAQSVGGGDGSVGGVAGEVKVGITR